MRRVLLSFILLAGMTAPSLAQDVPPFDVSALMERLPDKTLKSLRRAPDRFIEEAAELIVGFGGDAGLNLAGIDRYIALERARTRAREIAQLMRADLDNDQMISRAEVEALIATQSATLRGRILLGFRGADADTDDTVSVAELRSFAQSRAMAWLSVEDAAVLRSFMGFDLDHDRYVTLDEVILVVQAFQAEA